MMAAKRLHQAVQDALHNVAPPIVDHLGNEHRMFDYAECDDVDTRPGYAWDILRTAHRAGYPADRLLDGVLDIVERVITYREAALEMCANLLMRMRTVETKETGDLSIERYEFPMTYLGRALEDLHEAMGEEEAGAKLRHVGDALDQLQCAIHDWEEDHFGGKRLAQAVFQSINQEETTPEPRAGISMDLNEQHHE